jgi:hypothetical protein
MHACTVKPAATSLAVRYFEQRKGLFNRGSQTGRGRTGCPIQKSHGTHDGTVVLYTVASRSIAIAPLSGLCLSLYHLSAWWWSVKWRIECTSAAAASLQVVIDDYLMRMVGRRMIGLGYGYEGWGVPICRKQQHSDDEWLLGSDRTSNRWDHRFNGLLFQPLRTGWTASSIVLDQMNWTAHEYFKSV